MRPMSTTISGENSRIFISGNRLSPPASTLAPGLAARVDTASSIDEAATYSNSLGYIVYPLAS